MPNKPEALNLLDRIRWYLGWRPRVALISGLVVGLGMALLIQSEVGIVFGAVSLILWFQGTRTINANWKAHISYVEHVAKEKGAETLGIKESARTFPFHHREGVRVARVEPLPHCQFTFLFLCDTFVGLYSNNSIDLINLESKLGTKSNEIYLRHVNGVAYDGKQFELKTSSGEKLSYLADAESGESAVNAIRQKLRQLQTVS